MTRITLPRFVLRRLKRAANRAFIRSPIMEQLDARIVLTGMPEAVCLDTPAASAEIPADTTQPTTVSNSVDTASPVFLDSDGVLHIQPSDTAGIVVRQFVNYQLEEVIEVEMDGQWTSTAAEQVREVQVHQISPSQPVTIDANVAILVQVIEPEVVDAAFASSADEFLIPDLPVASFDQLTEEDPEGEYSGGAEYAGDEDLSPPVIVDFVCYQEDGYWVFTGQVTDDKSVAGLEIRFGGLLDGSVAIVDADGSFSITAVFPPGVQGAVTAITTDTDDLDSNEMYCGVNL